ncbi:mitochondrial ribosomal protein L37-domain-containing protein [Bombardia bombarda]|uniref:Large ribosomal subunit protein mL54 n=1 Tax=Bombardia bombarda TaxID=252184 RepID=A0AA39XA39_9PEZI|nr:mitochondrial ribosomal protein L37-domain-containing protein [Bombardia bombarda]
MICRTCLRQGTGLSLRLRQPIAVASSVSAARAFTTTIRTRNAAAAAAAAAVTAAAPTPAPATASAAPTTPIDGDPAAAEEKAALSSCPAGTVLNGLNYFKGKADPVALADEKYPEWLWRCLEVQKKADEEADTDAGDIFSKSKKQRRLAAKRQRLQETKMLESGDMEALAPKIPLQKQSINLPGSETGSVQDAVVAVEKREELRKALRKERKAKIKEANYLKTM